MNRLSIAVLLLFTASLSILEAGFTSSIFKPSIRTEAKLSLLMNDDPYNELGNIAEGLVTPFDSLSAFKSSLIEAFLPAPSRRSIFQYGYRSSTLLFKSEINAIAGYEYSQTDDFSYGYLYKGMRVNAEINKNWKMRSYWHSGAFFGDAQSAVDHSPLVDGFYKTQSNSVWIDNLRADITYLTPWLQVSLGRDNFQIGNSISGSIILNNECNEYGYALAEGTFGRFKLSLLHGTLIADDPVSIYEHETVANSKHYPEKNLALHQITYTNTDRFELFFGESVIYGDRGLDVNYLMPQAFWRVTEHNLQDRDNILIYGGINLKPLAKTTIYTQAVIDEMRYKEFMGNWWGNKWAVQSGVSRFFGKEDKGRIGFEFTAVRPWIYTHYLPYTPYSHDSKPLGYPKGSNLIDYSAELNYSMNWQTSITAKASYTRQGSTGNNFSINYLTYVPDIDNTTADWLQGTVSDTFSLNTIVKSSFFAHHNILLGHKACYDKVSWDHLFFGAWQFIY